MRTAFFILLLANLGFFAWSYYGSELPGSEMQLIEQQLNPQAIRLLTAEQRASLAAERPKAPAVKACIELGPFNMGDVPNVEQALGPLALGPKLSQRRVDELASYWVFIPAQASRQGAIRKTAELRKLGVEDFFVVQEDPSFRFAISLGIFKTEEAAKAQLEQLRSKGVRSARVGVRETSVQKNYFMVRDVPDALASRLEQLRQGFPGSELKECQPGEKRT
jgi:hypothetical protein